MSTAIIFVLLVVLMLTGMPISISLGLTVLSFLFFMTQVPIESVALKLFTGIEKFEIMAIPFFILAGNFLTHGGVAKRMIAFATSMVGHLLRRAGPGRRAGLRAVRRGIGFVAGDGGGDRVDPDAGDGQGGIPEALRRRRHHDIGRFGHPDPAVDRDGHVFGVDQHLGRRAVHGRRDPRPRACLHARHDHLVPRAQQQLPAHAQGELGGAIQGLQGLRLGLAADRHRDGRHLLRGSSRRPRPPR